MSLCIFGATSPTQHRHCGRVKCDMRVPPGTMCASLCGKGLLYEDKRGSGEAWRREELAGVAHSGDLAVI